ncbi:MAG: diacylglycerol kinase [Pirellulaceae bacterium]|nr:diacylglycerol kinase [Pirellulaceae bacterium]
MSEPDYQPPRRSWPRKFRNALAAIGDAMRWQSSFHVHLVCAALALGLAAGLRVGRTEWCLIALSVAGVLAAEMFNTALEVLAKAVDRRHNPHLARALNMASGAVLLAALGAVAVGLLVFVPRLLQLLVPS